MLFLTTDILRTYAFFTLIDTTSMQ